MKKGIKLSFMPFLSDSFVIELSSTPRGESLFFGLNYRFDL